MTESVTPVNSVGTSSSSTGPIRMVDPLLGGMLKRNKQGKKLRDIVPLVPNNNKKK